MINVRPLGPPPITKMVAPRVSHAEWSSSQMCTAALFNIYGTDKDTRVQHSAIFICSTAAPSKWGRTEELRATIFVNSVGREEQVQNGALCGL